jgi:predicted HTH transcriptional regulator
MRKEIEKIGISLLESSLEPLPHEKNELDWKADLSENSDKLAKHLSAFANLEQGGFLIFGIDDTGTPRGIRKTNYQDVIKKLGNIARDSVVPSIALDHSIISYGGVDLLLIYIPESKDKPIHLRSGTVYDSYTRSVGQTRKMTRQEVARCIATSSGTSFENENAVEDLAAEEVIKRLDIQSFFDLLSKPFPQDRDAILDSLEGEGIVKKIADKINILNLGALLFAKDLRDFNHLKRKAVRVIIYEKADRRHTLKEQEFTRGYASGFESIVQYIADQTPSNEVIEKAFRKNVKMYPGLAIRELVANAIIHQDFNEIGTGPMVEIFSDRIEITNPGRPLISISRFIDSPPQSRNESLASSMRRANICEERGSGIDKVIFEVEFYQLPPPSFVETDNHTKVTLYSYQPLTKMERADKIRACYQHCCLKHVSGERMSNQTLRKRFDIEEKNYSTASRIIADSIQAKLIKLSDPESRSKKYATYLPFWA